MQLYPSLLRLSHLGSRRWKQSILYILILTRSRYVLAVMLLLSFVQVQLPLYLFLTNPVAAVVYLFISLCAVTLYFFPLE